jgi:ribosome-associated translation inhibitor RaiA
MVERKIQVTHLLGANSSEKAGLMQSMERHYDKLANFLHGELSLDVRFREARKEGSRTLVEVKAKAVSPTKMLNAHASDWTPEKALKSALDALLKEAQKTKPTSKKN